MIVIADNDIIHKLAICDLLSELLVWLQVPPNEIWVLPQLQFRVRKKLRGNAIAIACFDQFLQVTGEIPAASSASIAKFDQLDFGEQQLMAVFIEQAEAPQLVTGDKRALKQLSEMSKIDEALQLKLNGKVECLEGVMLGLIQLFGFENINSKISTEADGVFRLAFGEGKSIEHATEALQSYLQHLRTSATFVIPH